MDKEDLTVLKELVDSLDLQENWRADFEKWVPLFIEEAKTKTRWQDWDKEIFEEYFTKGKNQCVSSIPQYAYFTLEEQEKIKAVWNTEIAPILKEIATQCNQFTPSLYKQLTENIKKYTSPNYSRDAAINRMIAGIQPETISTISSPKHLYNFKKLINQKILKNQKISGATELEISHQAIRLIKELYPEKTIYQLATLPWKLYECLKEKTFLQCEEQDKMQLEEALNLLKYKKQIILQGPPGTGKTRLAKQLAAKLLGIDGIKHLKSSEQFKLIQFHPSYSYEDFVRGIVIKNTDDGTLEYQTEDKILAEMAARAQQNFEDSQKDSTELNHESISKKHFEEFVEHIQEHLAEHEQYKLTENISLISSKDTDAFRYKGHSGSWSKSGSRMLYKDILKAYLDNNKTRQDIKNNLSLSGLARQHASYYVRVLNNFQNFVKGQEQRHSQQKQNVVEQPKLKNYVLIIDEINRANLSAVLGELIYALEYRGEAVESMYARDGDKSIIIPDNFYIIGTMNTADRSVGHIDYAIRRRFAFVSVLPQDLSDELFENFDKSLFDKVSSLFDEDENKGKHLSPEFKKAEVQLGHSYFITKDVDIDTRLEYEIKPILYEYVRDGILKESAVKEIENLSGQDNNSHTNSTPTQE